MTFTLMATDHGTITIREANLADLDAIKLLHEQVYQETTAAFSEPVLSPSTAMASAIERRIRTQAGGHPAAQLLVAQTEAGDIIGYVMARHYRRSSSSIDQEVVAKDFRAYGIGKELTELVIERAKVLKKNFVELNVSEAGNVGFHARQGFSETRRRPPHADRKFSSLVMQRRLDTPASPDERTP